MRLRRPAIAITGLLLLAALPACSKKADNPVVNGPTTAAASPSATASVGGSSPTLTVYALQSLAFDPRTLTAKVGETVTGNFIQKGSIPHTFTITALNVDVTTNAAGDSKPFTFVATKAGTYKYVCRFHSTMSGTLTVT